MGSSKHKHRSRSGSRTREHRKEDRDKEYKRSHGKHKKHSRDSSREHTKVHHSRRRRSPSRSSTDSSSSSSSSGHHRLAKSVDAALIQELERERQRLKLEKKKAKEAMKATETPEQKRLRRLAKKEAKERKRKAEMGWDEEYLGYTNTDNPFGDANLLKTFKWEKKFEKEGLKHAPEEELELRNKLKLEENRRELEKVKQRRLEREREREQREEELTRIQREKEAAQFEEWEKQEDIFHLQQAKLRSKIRIDDGRAKPIDLLARYISAEEEDFGVEMLEPYIYLNGLTTQDLEDLQEDIKVYMELESSRNLNYWRDIQIIVEEELRKLRRLDTSSIENQIGERREGINSSVSTEVVEVFKGKTPSQLQALYQQIEKKIHSKEEGLDVPYWETLLSRLKAHMARARLRERHQENLRHKLYQLKQEQGVESGPLFPCVKQEAESLGESEPIAQPGPSRQEVVPDSIAVKQSPDSESEDSEDTEEKKDEEPMEEPEDPIQKCEEEYRTGGYSPKLLRPEDLEPATILIDTVEDNERLEYARRQLIGTGKVQDMVTQEERAFEVEARKGMDNDEASFSVESPVDKTYLWSDKYRPRKPRYFNRVHTGFEWNKYNQTHYDMDNPPPKIVQGYKFNIFYPDLIDKQKTPEYFLTPIEGNKDFSILRFHAGPPYEDIAFKIVNREWEYSYKRGFRCQFHNNIFQLWFHFKRYRYRR
ncbi:splicing factor Cactin-like [Ornithodoros turicata]|uniref:splicing factor Cactin-like n=1 Tax=Ornithodoros turicata TaxID=34597 RepID=UPI00313A3000